MTTNETTSNSPAVEVDTYDLPDQQSDLVLELVLARGTTLASALELLLGPTKKTGKTRTLSVDTDTEAYFAVKDRGWYVYGAEVDQTST